MLSKKVQIKTQTQIQNGVILFDKALITILTKYSDYSNIFLAENVAKAFEYTEINDHAIKLEEKKQLRFRSIYSLGPVELKTLKIYIKINLVNNFIRSPKSPTKKAILFDQKPDESLCFCVDY